MKPNLMKLNQIKVFKRHFFEVQNLITDQVTDNSLILWLLLYSVIMVLWSCKKISLLFTHVSWSMHGWNVTMDKICFMYLIKKRYSNMAKILITGNFGRYSYIILSLLYKFEHFHGKILSWNCFKDTWRPRFTPNSSTIRMRTQDCLTPKLHRGKR